MNNEAKPLEKIQHLCNRTAFLIGEILNDQEHVPFGVGMAFEEIKEALYKALKQSFPQRRLDEIELVILQEKLHPKQTQEERKSHA